MPQPRTLAIISRRMKTIRKFAWAKFRRDVGHPSRSMPFRLLCALLLLTLCAATHAATINVPTDQPTIQAGINAAHNGDVVIVADGTYTGQNNRNLDFGGKSITVRSASNNPAQCVIDCQHMGNGFYFHQNETAAAIVSGFTIQNGSAGSPGGGGLLCFSSSPTVTNCAFRNNTAPYGGGMYNYQSNPSVTNCVFSGNSASYASGGGMYNASTAAPNVINCIFNGNSAASTGGGIYSDDSTAPTIINSTIFGNSAPGSGAGMFNSANSSVTVFNSIIGNGVSGGFVTLSHSDVARMNLAATPNANGNFDADPMFVNPANGDLHLQAGSPCIDAGDDSAIAGVTTDLDGNPRIVNAHVDLGAYEYQNVAPILNAIPNQTATAGQLLTFTPTLAQNSNHPQLTFSLVNAPAGVTINGNTGQVSWTPTIAGVYTFSVKVTDTVGLSDTKPVQVTVNSDPNGTARIIVTDIAAQRVSANTVTVTFNLSDAGTAALQNIRVARGQLRSVLAQTPLPGPFSLTAGNRQSVTLTFTSTSAIPVGFQLFVMNGSYQSSAGANLTFSTGVNISVP